MKKDNEDFFKSLFKSKEINLKKEQTFDAKNDRVSADLLKDAFEVKFKDSDGRIIFHRAAIEQKTETIFQALQNINILSKQQLSKILEQKDNYGNTALALASIYDIEAKRNSRYEVMKQLLVKGANPNVFNPRTFFTPLHWAAVNGATDIVKLLLKFDAKEYVPDINGLFPIDYAGYFRHHETVKILAQQTLSRVEKYKRANQTDVQWESLLSPFIDRTGKAGMQGLNHDNLLLLFNPVFHTSILYWASIFNEIEDTLVQEILVRLEAYPEGPIIISNWKTPCHAAAYLGSVEKLKLLLTDIFNRYKKESLISKVNAYKKTQYCP